MNINKSDGWIKLHKKIIESDLVHDVNAFRLFTSLLLMAHHEDNQGSIKLNKKQVYLKKGQLVATRSELAEFLNMPQSTVRNALNRLKQDKRVDIVTDKQNTLITICKWNEYQSVENKQVDKVEDNDRTTTGQRVDSLPLSQKNRRSKEYIPKGIEAYGKPEINDLFEYWTLTTGYPISSKVQSNRNAANNLFKKHGDKGVRKLIDGVNMAQQDKFAPRIGDFVDLQANLNKLLAWGKNNKAKNMEVIS